MRLPIQVQAILFRRTDGRIQYLLLKRVPGRGALAEGFWQPVTGGIEEGEKRVDAVKREVSEETGIKNVVRIIENVHQDEFWDFFKPEDRQRLIEEYVFGVGISSDEKIVVSGEHSEHKWCGLEEALKLLKWKENKEALTRLNEILTE